jgi:hypothetical protein
MSLRVRVHPRWLSSLEKVRCSVVRKYDRLMVETTVCCCFPHHLDVTLRYRDEKGMLSHVVARRRLSVSRYGHEPYICGEGKCIGTCIVTENTVDERS